MVVSIVYCFQDLTHHSSKFLNFLQQEFFLDSLKIFGVFVWSLSIAQHGSLLLTRWPVGIICSCGSHTYLIYTKWRSKEHAVQYHSHSWNTVAGSKHNTSFVDIRKCIGNEKQCFHFSTPLSVSHNQTIFQEQSSCFIEIISWLWTSGIANAFWELRNGKRTELWDTGNI